MKYLYVIIFSALLAFGHNLKSQENPQDILAKAAEACKSLKSLVYQISGDVVGRQVKAQVTSLKRHGTLEFGYGQSLIKVEGKMEISKEVWKDFAFVYNGSEFKAFSPLTKSATLIKKPEGKGINRHISFELFLVPFFQYTQAHPFDDGRARQGESLNYVGLTKYKDRSVHIVEIERLIPTAPGSSDMRKSITTWFFDAQSYLPVGLKGGSNDSDKKTKWASLLSIDEPVDDSVFDIEFPEEYEITVYETGLEPIATGLLSVGEKAPDFRLNDNLGMPKAFTDIKGKLTLIDFWGTWCAPCIRVMPDLEGLHKKYGSKGLSVVGISVNDPVGKAEKFIEKRGFTYQFLVQGKAVARKFKIDSYPTFYLIDENGIIIHAEKGVRDGAKEEVEKIIEKYIN